MLRTCLSLGLFFACHLLTQAQILTPKVGVSYSKAFNPEDTEVLYRDARFRPGFLVGFAVNAPLSGALFFETGFLYVQKGNKMTEEGKGSVRYHASHNYLLEFIEIPVLLKYKLDKRNITFYPLVGVSASYGVGGNVNGSIEIEGPGGQMIDGTSRGKIYFNKSEERYPNDIHLDGPLDLGIQIGVDALLFDRVNLSVRYSRGLKEFEYRNGLSGYNQSIQFHAGIPLKLVTRIESKTSEEKPAADKGGVRVYTGLSFGERVSTFQGSEADYRLKDDPDSYFRKRRTVIYGFDFKVETSSYFFVRTGLFSIENGATHAKDGFTYPFHATTRYFSLPMLVGAQPLNFSNVGLFNLAVEGGIAANLELESDKEALTTGLHPDTDIKMKKFLLAAQVGLTFEVRISKAVMLLANYRYFQDISPFFKRTIGDQEFDLFNKGTSLKGGLMFRVK